MTSSVQFQHKLTFSIRQVQVQDKSNENYVLFFVLICPSIVCSVLNDLEILFPAPFYSDRNCSLLNDSAQNCFVLNGSILNCSVVIDSEQSCSSLLSLNSYGNCSVLLRTVLFDRFGFLNASVLNCSVVKGPKLARFERFCFKWFLIVLFRAFLFCTEVFSLKRFRSVQFRSVLVYSVLNHFR